MTLVFVNLSFTVQQISLVTFINNYTHTPKGGVPIVWRNIYPKRKEKTFCWFLRIAEDTLFCFQSIKFSKNFGLWSTLTI